MATACVHRGGNSLGHLWYFFGEAPCRHLTSSARSTISSCRHFASCSRTLASVGVDLTRPVTELSSGRRNLPWGCECITWSAASPSFTCSRARYARWARRNSPRHRRLRLLERVRKARFRHLTVRVVPSCIAGLPATYMGAALGGFSVRERSHRWGGDRRSGWAGGCANREWHDR